jgi:hypothetical protein
MSDNRTKWCIEEEFESKVEAYLHMAPQIMIESLNYHFHSQERTRKTPKHYDSFSKRIVSNSDEWEDFDFNCLLEALQRSQLNCSQIFLNTGESRILNGPFRLNYFNGHRLGPSKFTLTSNKKFNIIGG